MRAAHPLDTSVPVALDDRAPWFEWMAEKWPDRATVIHCHEVVRRLEVERAAQPPEIHVTVPGVPGHFTGQPGGPVAYLPDPDSLA
jgi:hypothetical protein